MNILLVKLSSLGDVAHTLPVVADILAAHPGAQIDWVVEKPFAQLVALHPGVRRVIACELRRWRKVMFAANTRLEWRAFKADLQARSYDAVIDLQGLTKSALIARLARLSLGGKRFALANQTEGSGYEAPTRWLADVAIALPARTAALARGRLLAGAALGYSLGAQIDFGLADLKQKVPAAQVIPAAAAIENIANSKPKGTVALIHGSSRADKLWPSERWAELGQRLCASGLQVALVHGSAAELRVSQQIASAVEQLGGQAGVWPILAIDALTRQLATCVGAIGVDSGVSHIAAALDLPSVQIYNFDTAWRTGPEPSAYRRAVFAPGGPTVDAVWQAWLACKP